MPDSKFALQIICEVHEDRLPSPGHAACVTAFRRLQINDAVLCTPLINDFLQRLQPPRKISSDDLVMTQIHLPPSPLRDPHYEIAYRTGTLHDLIMTVVFKRGVPMSVKIDTVDDPQSQ
jgi:hypothetical protein